MIIIRILLLLFLIYICLCVAIYFLQDKLVFFPEKLPADYKYQLAGEFEEINFEISDSVKINAIKIKVENPKGIIVYTHGNAGSLDGWSTVGFQFAKLGYDFIIYDYRSYGKSTGEISEQNLYDDSEIIYNKLKQDYKESEMILYGRSLGTGIAAYVASRNNPKKLILETPYFNFTDVAKMHYPIFPTFILKYKFPNNEFLKSVKCPVVIIHGTDDEIVPYISGKKLEPLLKDGDKFITIEGGHHNDLSAYPKFSKELEKLLK